MDPNSFFGLFVFIFASLLRLYFLCSFGDDITENVRYNYIKQQEIAFN